MQQTFLWGIDGGQEAAAARWDARAARDIGLIMRRYLAENPAPAGSQYAADLRRQSDEFADLGLELLRAQGVPALRLA
jgi:hypothetical protein